MFIVFVATLYLYRG